MGEGERPSSSGGGGGGAVVVGIEHIPTLTALAEKNIRMDGLGKAIDEQGIVLVTGDGRLGSFSSSFVPFGSGVKPEFASSLLLGYAEKAPYDAIHVGAAARMVPTALVEQLASPGRMIIPVGTYSQRLMQVDKDAQGQITQRDLFGVVVRIQFFFFAHHNAYNFIYFLSCFQYVPLTDRPA